MKIMEIKKTEAGTMTCRGNVQLLHPGPTDPLIYKLGELAARAGGTGALRRYFDNGVIGGHLYLNYGDRGMTVRQGWGDRLVLARITDGNDGGKACNTMEKIQTG